MSREIKFRGNSLVTKEEVFGHLFYFDDGRYFISPKGVVVEGDEGEYPSEYYLRGVKCIEVEPETVGQYTGLKDKNGVEIYDILDDKTDKAKELQKYSEQIAKKKEDLVNHPAHYNQYSQEVIDTIEEVTVNMPVTVAYHVGNAVKYLFRAPFKGKLKQDLEKAVWYLERAVSKL